MQHLLPKDPRLQSWRNIIHVAKNTVGVLKHKTFWGFGASVMRICHQQLSAGAHSCLDGACEAHGCEIHLGNCDLILTQKRAFHCFSASQGNSSSRLNNAYHTSICSLLRLFVFCVFACFACLFLQNTESGCSSFLPTIFSRHWKRNMGGNGGGCLNFLLSDIYIVDLQCLCKNLTGTVNYTMLWD